MGAVVVPCRQPGPRRFRPGRPGDHRPPGEPPRRVRSGHPSLRWLAPRTHGAPRSRWRRGSTPSRRSTSPTPMPSVGPPGRSEGRAGYRSRSPSNPSPRFRHADWGTTSDHGPPSGLPRMCRRVAAGKLTHSATSMPPTGTTPTGTTTGRRGSANAWTASRWPFELAAARGGSLSPAQILDGLADAFRLLSGGGRAAANRPRRPTPTHCRRRPNGQPAGEAVEPLIWSPNRCT